MGISSRLWPASSWSVLQSVRTNNNVEGWHNPLNQQARRGKLDVYQLAALLFGEADFVSLQCVLISERRLLPHQWKCYARVQGRLDTYEMTSALLKKCLNMSMDLVLQIGPDLNTQVVQEQVCSLNHTISNKSYNLGIMPLSFRQKCMNQLWGFLLLLFEAKCSSGLIMSIINTGLILKVVDRLKNW